MLRLPRFFRRRRRNVEIEPDEIFLDASNLPEFDREQFEGRLERPIRRESLLIAGACIALLVFGYGIRAFNLMVVHGTAYAKQAAENQLEGRVMIASRGTITDRKGRELAFNDHTASSTDFTQRQYADFLGLAHTLGYVKPPAKDSKGFYYRDSYEGIDGIEEVFDEQLKGTNGQILTEVNARGEVVSQSTVREPKEGKKITLSLDAEMNQALFRAISTRAEQSHFQGASGVVMDLQTGELLALTSFPEYSSQALSNGDSESLAALSADKRQPFLNRAVNGLYAPGSIVKPIVAAAALEEGVIDETTEILSTGSISIPNPYNPSNPSIFKDWKAHGYVDMRQAIAVSSDVYFYEVGGGFQSQPGLGIARLDRYFKLFGFEGDPGLTGMSSAVGTIPTPEWKEKVFDGDPWRVGDTYNTSIGQYGVQITPLQAVRAIAAVGNGGKLLTPTLLASSTPRFTPIPIGQHPLQVAREGMRLAASVGGTAAAVSLPFVNVGGKTGTAQVGAKNEFMNSWIVGFFPYEHPRYAFAVVLERAPAGTLVGAPAAMSDFFWWMNANAKEYLQ
ncbi:hypothetical protein H7X87_00145 [Acetobacteraceae bacterium]|nr:hypothetical protein [Candidatus Parcubacteria bacterium]